METYEKYKPSGIDWIGEVPEHWECTKLKHYSDIVLGKMLMSSPPKGEEDSYTLEKYLKSKNIGWLEVFNDEDDVEEMWFSDYEKSLYLLRDNDIVMNEGGDIGKVAIWKNVGYDCYIQNSVNKITVGKKLSPFYLMYLLFAIAKTNYFWSIVSQISIAHLTKEKLMNTPIIIPPLAEQEAIAAYLDARCADIDKVVATQQKRIALLQELKQSEITQAVTRGLNPDARMKDSGVEWIGMVPEHWEVMGIKHGVNAISDVNHYMPADVDNGYPYVMTGDLKEYTSKIEFDNCKQIAETDFKELSKKSKAEIGDVIFARYATIGTVCYVDIIKDFVVSYSCVTIKVNKRLDGKFLFWFLKSDAFYSGIVQSINSNTQGNVGIESLSSAKIALPPIDEQIDIIEHLDRRCGEIDKQIGAVTKQIELLREYKQALITEVVTGKRRV